MVGRTIVLRGVVAVLVVEVVDRVYHKIEGLAAGLRMASATLTVAHGCSASRELV